MLTTFAIVFIISYVWHALGITVGYHRLLSHRSFRCNKALEYALILGGYLAMEGSPIWWISIHRAHHKHVDTPLDPHSPLKGWFESLYGWMFKRTYPAHIIPAKQCPDMVNDPIYNFLEQGGDWKRNHILCYTLNILYRVIIWGTFGWVAALASLAAGICVLQVPLMLNFFCHIPKLGYKNYESNNDAVNVWWIGLIAMGEGWHNNHHEYPGAARNGFKWFEIDCSWYALLLFRKLGWASHLNEGPNAVHAKKEKTRLRHRIARRLAA
jgi:fatty-acid desaturase